MVSFNSPRSFHLFILRQEYLYSVCTVSPQIKHSLCIPYEMYLLRFGRGGRQVLGYTNSESPPFPIRREQRQATHKEHGLDRKHCAFIIKAGKRVHQKDMAEQQTLYLNKHLNVPPFISKMCIPCVAYNTILTFSKFLSKTKDGAVFIL